MRARIFLTLICAVEMSLRAELFVSSFNNGRVYRFNETNGAFMDVFIPNTNGLLSLQHGPSDMVFGPDENLYVVGRFNDCVGRFDGTTGAFMHVFGATVG